MLKITIPAVHLWDETKEEFIDIKEQTLQLEHSLVSLSKWESKWCKPFLSDKEKTIEETIDYIRCMTLTQNVDPRIYNFLTNENIEAINKYIDSPMTATTFANDIKNNSKKEIITAEIIYYWMISFNIPVKFDKWHLNRLLTLIRVFNIKNKPPKKMSRTEIMRRNTELNEYRKKQLDTNG